MNRVYSMPVQATNGKPAIRAKRVFASSLFFAIAWIAYVSNKAETSSDATCAILLLAFGIVPTFIWIARWIDTLPMMPIYGLVNVLHFGLPFTSQTSDVLNYSEPEKFAGTLTVCGMLAVATLAWTVAMSSLRIKAEQAHSLDTSPIEGFLPYGFAIALIYNSTEVTGLAYELGNFLPILRAFCGSIFFISAYLLGALWANGQLKIRTKILCGVLFVLAAVVTWGSLYLHPSLFVAAMFCIGYMISSRRIPVSLVVVILAVFVVLQSGKAAIREKYMNESPVNSILELPGFASEWIAEGFFNLATPTLDQGTVQFGDRIGLMHMLLRARSMTPDQVDFLHGETYALIPRLLLPRFLDPNKPSAHEGLIMLNVRYGLLLPEEIDQTSIGWGMLPEAFANFGDYGVAGLGLIMGFLFAAITRWSSGAPALSGRAMFSIMFLIAAFNLEADTAVFTTTVVQGAVAIAAINLLFGHLGGRSRRQIAAT